MEEKNNEWAVLHSLVMTDKGMGCILRVDRFYPVSSEETVGPIISREISCGDFIRLACFDISGKWFLTAEEKKNKIMGYEELGSSW